MNFFAKPKFAEMAGEISAAYGEPDVGRQILVCLNPPICLSSVGGQETGRQHQMIDQLLQSKLVN